MEKQYKKAKLSELKPYKNNPRNNNDAVPAIEESIRQVGYINPIVVDENNEVLAGHTRLKALQEMGAKEAEVLQVGGLTEDQKRKYRLLDNKTSELAEWDFDLLELELDGLDFGDFDFDFGIEEDVEPALGKEEYGSLIDDFGAPPFSILDSKQGYWKNRKDEWKSFGIRSELGRDVTVIDNTFGKKYNRPDMPEMSIFDPVLCELMYKWFCPDGGHIYDCFAGGSVRGVVADKLGYKYTGIELRQEQVEANVENAKEIGVNPIWYCDDSLNADKYIRDGEVDMIFSCPPYADLEVYSDDPRDISNMAYEEFCKVYAEIITVACRKLKEDRFAVFVVGDVRDKKGLFRNFVDYTKKCFNDNGLATYNEAVYLESLGTAMLRAGRFSKNRKL